MPAGRKSSSAADYESSDIMQVELKQNLTMDFTGMTGQQRKELMDNMNELIEEFIEKLLGEKRHLH